MCHFLQSLSFLSLRLAQFKYKPLQFYQLFKNSSGGLLKDMMCLPPPMQVLCFMLKAMHCLSLHWVAEDESPVQKEHFAFVFCHILPLFSRRWSSLSLSLPPWGRKPIPAVWSLHSVTASIKIFAEHMVHIGIPNKQHKSRCMGVPWLQSIMPLMFFSGMPGVRICTMVPNGSREAVWTVRLLICLFNGPVLWMNVSVF